MNIILQKKKRKEDRATESDRRRQGNQEKPVFQGGVSS